MNNDMLPVGTTINIKPEDVKWDSGDLISRSELKKEFDIIASNSATGEWQLIPIKHIKQIIDNAPTASDRYYEGYAQGYIHGSTGADWQGE